MSISHRSADTLLGLLIVTVAGALVVALIFTQGWTERRFNVLMVTESAEELNPGTVVLFEGLEIGRITRIVPRPDTIHQTMQFVATLRLRSRFPDGSALKLPIGTRAEIDVYALKAADVMLRLPAHWAGTLKEGDTLRASRKVPALDVIAGVADTLAVQMRLVMADARTLMASLNTTAGRADRELAATGPGLRKSLSSLDSVLRQTQASIASMAKIVDLEGTRLGPMHDSLTMALGQAHNTMASLDTLAVMGTAVAGENRADVHTMLVQMRRISVKMEYYLDQLGRKPIRMFTGIKPFPDDSTGGTAH